MIISFSGTEGSGKSTIAKRLAEKLKIPRYYMGALRREAAQKKGLTLAQYNKLGEEDPLTDFEVDEHQRQLGRERDNFIIEGRTSWYFIPHSLKIYLDVKPEIGAKRIFESLQKKNDRNEDRGLETWENVLASNQRRQESDRLRYQKYYNINVNDPNHYDFYLDTSNLNADQVYNKVEEFVLSKGKKKKKS
ncbi:MAG: cytidylate kinase family protein [Patescibacteria group bacterium]|nr:cytidylate kinase family protein [Patescibacteria group bacterium]MDD3777819.1 cytidylate kinase family protein [Patescibacteria group bacterium]MDD3939488.1 cytidylate kinase family protein [Patescibacteria group bacterium]MDD4443565.1 cytidylate kinase family protein [Patescibacteria group bacterium]NCU39738.1 hypothetical protein [Candidatus Falkowbacteria bacterium]